MGHVSRQFHEQEQPLFVLDIVDTDAVGAGKQIPAIVSSMNGAFTFQKRSPATRSNNKVKSYNVITTAINSYSSFQTIPPARDMRNADGGL